MYFFTLFIKKIFKVKNISRLLEKNIFFFILTSMGQKREQKRGEKERKVYLSFDKRTQSTLCEN